MKMNYKCKSKFLLVVSTTVIMLISHNTSAQNVPDILDNIRRVLSKENTYANEEELIKSVETFVSHWHHFVLSASFVNDSSSNISLCTNDLISWGKALLGKEYWSLSSKYNW